MSLSGTRSTSVPRWLIAIVATCAFLVIAPPANATITNVFSATAAPIPCAVQGTGVRLCDQTIAGNPGGTARSTVADASTACRSTCASRSRPSRRPARTVRTR